MYHNPVEVPQKERVADRYICGILLTVILILILAEENKNTGKVRNFNSENAGIGKDIEHKSYLDDALLIERQSVVNVAMNGLEKND